MYGMVALFPLVLIFGYLGVRKLTYSYEYCGSYGQIDDRLGWVLAPNRSSCLNLQNRLKGTTYFASTIFTNDEGLRSSAPDSQTHLNAFVAVGDSWVFGYGVNYEEAWPYHLERAIGLPVNNLGVPNYSTAQTYLLLERKIKRLKPRLVIYMNQGMWSRSVCIGPREPTKIMEPCFWWNSENGGVRLTTPPGVYVSNQAAKNIYPGGIFTSGYDPWKYFLIIRPLEYLRAWRDKIFGMDDASGETFLWELDDPPVPDDAREAIFVEELTLYSRLMREHGFSLVWIDKKGNYERAVQTVSERENVDISYMGRKDWADFVEAEATHLEKGERFVPGDGHYSNAMNAVIAQGIAKKLASLGLVK